MLRTLYSMLLYLLIPFVIARLVWRGLQNPAYLKRWRERFGFPRRIPSEHRLICVHAVSVGEVQASRPLITRLLRDYADHGIVVTTTTPTGSDSVKQFFGDDVKTIYLPYDLPFAVRRFIATLNPVVMIVLETELWPNLFHHCRARSIPVILANARLSDHSQRRYQYLASLTRTTLEAVTLYLAQTEHDAKRLIALGAKQANVKVVGNLKFDQRPIDITDATTQALNNYFSPRRNIWIAASTHGGEEAIVLAAFLQVLKHDPHCLLIIAPRHPHRSETIRALCAKNGLAVICKSDERECGTAIQVFILDRIGELAHHYAIADVAFVGGSLIEHGGHNLLEPAGVGVPVLTGPHVFNFAAISRRLLDEHAAWQVNNADELAQQVIRLLTDDVLRREAGEKGRRMVRDNQGSIETTMRFIEPILSGGRKTDSKKILNSDRQFSVL